jgi:hypothetical protein
MSNIVGKSMPGTTNWMQEVARHFVANTQEVANMFVVKRDLEQQLSAAQSELGSASKALPMLKTIHDEALTKHESAMQLQPQITNAILYGGSGGALVVLSFINPIIGIVLGLIAFGVLFYLQKKQKDEIALEQSNAKATLDDAKGKYDAGSKRKNDAEELIAKLEKGIKENTPEDHSFQIGKIYYPMKVANFGGNKVVLDYAGRTQSQSFEVPDLSADVGALEDVSDGIEEVQDPPVLIEARQEDGDELDSLLGNEAKLKKTVEEFQDVVTRIELVEREVPLIDKTDDKGKKILKILSKAKPNSGELNGRVVPIDKEIVDEHVKNMDDVVKMVDAIKQGDTDVVAQLEESYQSLENTINMYSELRNTALHIHHQGVGGIQQRSSWLSYNFYCPSCNQVPSWVYLRAGITPDLAKTMSYDAIMEKLSSYDVSQKLFATEDPESNSCPVYDRKIKLRVVTKRRAKFVQKLSGLETEGASEADRRKKEKGIRIQIDSCEQQIERIVHFFLFGKETILTEINDSSRLRYQPSEDPSPDDQGTWTCQKCEQEWPEGVITADGDLEQQSLIHEAKLGAVPLWMEKLLLPLWNHLWTEKKTNIIAEAKDSARELRDRGVDEMDAINHFSSQFSDQMSPIMTKLIDLASDAGNKRNQLVSTLRGLKKVGIIGQKDVDEMLNALGRVPEQKVAQAEMDMITNSLRERSKEQASLRPDFVVPLEQLRDPSFVFEDDETMKQLFAAYQDKLDGIKEYDMQYEFDHVEDDDLKQLEEKWNLASPMESGERSKVPVVLSEVEEMTDEEG